LKAHPHFDQFHRGAKKELLARLRRLLLNNLVDFRRRYEEAQKRAGCLEAAALDWQLLVRTRSGPVADGPSPSAEAIAREQAESLERTLDRLPEDYRHVLVGRHQEPAGESLSQRRAEIVGAGRATLSRTMGKRP
jgi:DNA-directed RNA polymerase specialized sigma24 family protein